MDNTLSELVFILDMSGSMSKLTDDTIGGYNSLLNEQRDQKGKANITTVLFDHRYIILHSGVDIQYVEDITENEYKPRGMTAMLDAVGMTISIIDQKIANMPEDKRPGNVVVTIITDGHENASREYDWSTVQSMIEKQRTHHDWIFNFIGANIDTKKVGNKLGIDPRFAREYTHNKEGTDSVYKSVSNSVAYSRNSAMYDEDIELRQENMAKKLDEIE